ncbi:AAA family ATPase [Ferdinandcohnia quinoae]|uniref:MoxR family ATPase n=1 Tax=Fredinandcohnia quinoae TaxID=2918902 RepID=A0AAW5E1K2_9BACI|nr:MoxR family ATPase [Fredinandcohnia sp. SECRCQ15]MCH1623982.1 MoxR family ATPase [Fredinandcohnia sp. SECRCQ15]
MTNKEYISKLKENISQVIIGKNEVVELVLNSLINNGHILLESVPGTGKTMLAKSFAKSISGSFKRIQFTPDVLPSDVTGIQFFNPKEQEFQLRPGPVMTNILLADEINRATPRTQSSLLEVMEERQVTIDGETLKLPSPFIVIATQNPIESQQGTFPLPEAQMDRFFVQIDLGYPSFAEEKQIMQTYRQNNPIEELGEVLSKEDIEYMQREVQQVKLSDDVEDYLLRVIHATREHSDVEIGASPRGTLALMKAAQGRAYLDGRLYVTPEDIKYMAPFVIAHRLVLTMEGSLKKTNRQIIQELLSSVSVPVEAGAVN